MNPCSRPYTRAAADLDEDTVHVWRLPLVRPHAAVADFWQLLSADEREKAERFRFPADRRRFTVSRSMVRQILSLYTGLPAVALVFDYNQFGKPFLCASHDAIQFNVSHSGELALCAVARRPVGVDLEQVRHDLDYEPLARRFFHEQELAELNGLDGAARRQAFFQLWTCKEAYVKALGKGLSLPLNSFSVAGSSREGQPLYAVRGQGNAEWVARPIEPAPMFAGAVAAPGPDWTIQWAPAGRA